MSWDDAHRYYAALQEIEHMLDARRDGIVPWTSEYAAIFGTPARLVDALRTRWQTLVRAHDDGDPTTFTALAAAHPGLCAAALRPVQLPAVRRDAVTVAA